MVNDSVELKICDDSNNNNDDDNDDNFNYAPDGLLPTQFEFSYVTCLGGTDPIELQDENARLVKKCRVLFERVTELEDRLEVLTLDKVKLQEINAQHVQQLAQLRKLLKESIDLAEFERIKGESEQLRSELCQLHTSERTVRKELQSKQSLLDELKPRVEMLQHENDQLRAKMICSDNDSNLAANLLERCNFLHLQVEQLTTEMCQVKEENQELSLLLTRCQPQHTTPSDLVEVEFIPLSRIPSINRRMSTLSRTSNFNSDSNSNLNKVNTPVETMAEAQLKDLQLQLDEAKAKIEQLQRSNCSNAIDDSMRTWFNMNRMSFRDKVNKFECYANTSTSFTKGCQSNVKNYEEGASKQPRSQGTQTETLQPVGQRFDLEQLQQCNPPLPPASAPSFHESLTKKKKKKKKKKRLLGLFCFKVSH